MEANLRGFSAGDPALGNKAGTYVGTLEKLMHAKQQLGAKFTAVEFTPLMQGDRGPWPPKNPLTGEQLRDSWNYNQTAYQSPAGDLAHKPGNQVNEMKTLVRDVHQKLGAEVILDIVFNHTRESDPKGPTFSFRGLDNKTYYMLMPNRPELYRDLTGCGNTLNANNPRVQKLILDTLRYWVTDYHVDGFRFDLASVFKVEANGSESFKPPIIKAIENDPVLKNTKMIAEPWSMTQYHLGNFSDVRWGEWNGKFRDTVRRFVKGDTGQLADLATRIAGSDDMFDRSKGRNSINFVTAHDGFTLYDLVSYNHKHNLANGENNRDGSNDNFSWNHGHEGPVKNAPIPEVQKAYIEQLRTQQMKNMLSLLFLSQGVPMYLAGDDMRRTVDGNNNAWNGDKQNQVDWKLAQQNPDMLRFTSKMIELRQRAEIGKLQPKDITWHGVEPFKPQHYDQNRFIAWEYNPANPKNQPLYMAFNSYWEPITVKLPAGPWQKLVDTTQPMGRDIVDPGQGARVEHTYTIQPRSGIVLQSEKK
jgi:glycogen operon protein